MGCDHQPRLGRAIALNMPWVYEELEKETSFQGKKLVFIDQHELHKVGDFLLLAEHHPKKKNSTKQSKTLV